MCKGVSSVPRHSSQQGTLAVPRPCHLLFQTLRHWQGLSFASGWGRVGSYWGGMDFTTPALSPPEVLPRNCSLGYTIFTANELLLWIASANCYPSGSVLLALERGEHHSPHYCREPHCLAIKLGAVQDLRQVLAFRTSFQSAFPLGWNTSAFRSRPSCFPPERPKCLCSRAEVARAMDIPTPQRTPSHAGKWHKG